MHRLSSPAWAPGAPGGGAPPPPPPPPRAGPPPPPGRGASKRCRGRMKRAGAEARRAISRSARPPSPSAPFLRLHRLLGPGPRALPSPGMTVGTPPRRPGLPRRSVAGEDQGAAPSAGEGSARSRYSALPRIAAAASRRMPARRRCSSSGASSASASACFSARRASFSSRLKPGMSPAAASSWR